MNQPQRSAIAGLCISASCLVGIASHEGFMDHAYIPVKGDVPTIGFGHTGGVKAGQTVTVPRAMALLLKDANTASDGIKGCLNAPLYQYEFDAYSSLAFNVGATNVCKSSIPKKLKAGQYGAACDVILDFDHFHGKVNEGLKQRRIEEWQLCRGIS